MHVPADEAIVQNVDEGLLGPREPNAARNREIDFRNFSSRDALTWLRGTPVR